MRLVDVEQGTVAETCAGVRGGALAGHFADTQCAHDRAAVSRAASNQFNVGGASAEFFHFVSAAEYAIESGSVRLDRGIGILLPWASQHVGRNDNAGRGGVGVGFSGVAVLGPSEDRRSIRDQCPAGAFFIVAKQGNRLVRCPSAELNQLRAFSGSGHQQRQGSATSTRPSSATTRPHRR